MCKCLESASRALNRIGSVRETEHLTETDPENLGKYKRNRIMSQRMLDYKASLQDTSNQDFEGQSSFKSTSSTTAKVAGKCWNRNSSDNESLDPDDIPPLVPLSTAT